MKGRVLRFVAAALIVVTAVMLYQQQTKKAVAEQIAGCKGPEDNPELAIRDCTRLLRHGPYSPEDLSAIHLFRGRAHMALNNNETALIDFDLAARSNPENCWAWQLKSHVLRKPEEVSAAFDAIEEARELCPSRTYTVKRRIRLLNKMGRMDEAGAYAAELVEHYQSQEGEDRVPALRKLGKALLDVHQFAWAAVAYKDALLSDLRHRETFQMFFEACTHAGSDCPALFSEPRENHPELSCETAIMQWGENYPKFIEFVRSETEFESLQDFIENGGVNMQYIMQSVYLSVAGSMLERFPSDYSAQYIIEDRVFECVNGDKFVFPEGAMDKEVLRFDNENLFGPQVRANLLGLAYAALNE